MIPYTLLAFAAFVVMFSLAHVEWTMAVFSVLAGAALMATNSLAMTSIQSAVPGYLRGRVMALFVMAFVGIMPFSALIFGPVGQVIGPGPGGHGRRHRADRVGAAAGGAPGVAPVRSGIRAGGRTGRCPGVNTTRRLAALCDSHPDRHVGGPGNRAANDLFAEDRRGGGLLGRTRRLRGGRVGAGVGLARGGW